MLTTLIEWFHVLFRWIHIIAAIAWIGHAFFFNMLDHSLVPPDEKDPEKDKLEGEIWMVHGGGFYRVIKTFYLPNPMRGELHWFKWEAAFTWLSGFVLLAIVYYLSADSMMVDEDVLPMSGWTAIGISLGSLVGTWLVYDLLWISPLAKMRGVATALSVVLALGMVVLYSQLFSGRAAYLHTGAMLGTLMTGNVWVRIIPAMQAMVKSIKEGTDWDRRLGKAAKQRSRHNNYMVFPVIFIMISNHFPWTYGAAGISWLLLILIMLGAGGVRHWLNLNHGDPKHILVQRAIAGALVALSVTILIFLTAPSSPEPVEPVVPDQSGLPIDPDTTGSLSGVTALVGTAPEPQEMRMSADCQLLHGGTPTINDLDTRGGGLANVFVWIESGLDKWQLPAPSSDEVVIDQKACLYEPRMVGVQTGQPVAFLNSDPLFHNVRSETEFNTEFNEMMPTKNTRLVKHFRQPEVMVETHCDAHPWMKAYIGVVDHPFFAISDASGAFQIPGLPPGQYTLGVWHETLGKQTQRIEISANQEAEITIHLQAG